MLRSVNTYVTYGTPNVKAVRELVYKRGFANVNKQRIAITDNSVIQKQLGSDSVICTEDIVHELMTCGKNFGKVSKFLWPFKLNSPSGGFSKKRISFIEGRQCVRHSDREAFISQLIHRMIWGVRSVMNYKASSCSVAREASSSSSCCPVRFLIFFFNIVGALQPQATREQESNTCAVEEHDLRGGTHERRTGMKMELYIHCIAKVTCHDTQARAFP